MEALKLSDRGIEECARRAAEALHRGNVVLFPTDTLYGLGADALSDEAVGKVYDIKGRDERKPMHAIVADREMAQRYGEIDDVGRKLCEAFFPGPFTLIVKKRPEFGTGILRGIETFGFRIPANDFCIAAARAFGGPFTATSANKSGLLPQRRFDATLAQLVGARESIALAIDAGELPESKPSTVVDISSGRPLILRVGAISEADIWTAIGQEY